MSPIAAGGRLGRYQILRQLGAGAMGEVYLAEDPQIGRRVAIKTVKIEEGRPQEMEERKRRLMRESRAAGKLLHPNVVALFDVGEDAGVLFLAFECVEGNDLAERLESEPPVTLREAITYVRQAAEGLDYAHRQGVVHRDIKPSNLLISSSGTVKVSDFGIAKLKDQTSDLTMTGSVVGSPHYLSPEQIRGDELDGRSDIFSLGVLFYEVLSRRRPFEGETLTTLVYQILHRDPPSIVVDRPELGTRLENVLQRMLQKERDDRYSTAGEVARDLALCEQEIPAAILDRPAALESGAPTAATPRMSTSERAAQVASPASPATPPPAPPVSLTQAQTERLPPRLPPAVPGAPAPPSAPAAAAAGRSSSHAGLWIVGVLVALVVAALVVGGLAARRWVLAKQAGRVAQGAAAEPSSATAAGSTKQKAALVPSPPAQPSAPEANRESAASSDRQGSTPDAGERFRQTPPPVAPTPENRPQGIAPNPPRGEPAAEPVHVAAKKPVQTAPPAAEAEPEPASAPSESAPEVAEPLVDRAGILPRIDRMMVTGMALSFAVEPPEAIVKIDGRVIGQAGTWNAKKKEGRAYDLPESGDHLVRIFFEGRTTTIRVSASPEAPSPTLVSVDLRAPNDRGRKFRRAGDRP